MTKRKNTRTFSIILKIKTGYEALKKTTLFRDDFSDFSVHATASYLIEPNNI